MPRVQGYDFPDDATQDEINEALRQYAPAPAAAPAADPGTAALATAGRPYGQGAAESYNRGWTYGLSDVLGAAGSATGVNLDYPSPAGATWGERYQQALRQRQEAAKQYATDYPARNLAAEGAGMVTPLMAAPASAGAGLVSRIARNLGLGTLAGAAEATPRATQEPGMREALTDIGAGAALGGATGGGIGAATAPAVTKPLVGALARGIAPGIGGLVGGPFGAILGKEILDPMTKNIGPWLQGWVPPAAGAAGGRLSPLLGIMAARNALGGPPPGGQ
jgi:hypothetical protein